MNGFYIVQCECVNKVYYLGYKPTIKQLIKLCKRHSVYIDYFGIGLTPDPKAWNVKFQKVQYQDI